MRAKRSKSKEEAPLTAALLAAGDPGYCAMLQEQLRAGGYDGLVCSDGTCFCELKCIGTKGTKCASCTPGYAVRDGKWIIGITTERPRRTVLRGATINFTDKVVSCTLQRGKKTLYHEEPVTGVGVNAALAKCIEWVHSDHDQTDGDGGAARYCSKILQAGRRSDAPLDLHDQAIVSRSVTQLAEILEEGLVNHYGMDRSLTVLLNAGRLWAEIPRKDDVVAIYNSVLQPRTGQAGYVNESEMLHRMSDYISTRRHDPTARYIVGEGIIRRKDSEEFAKYLKLHFDYDAAMKGAIDSISSYLLKNIVWKNLPKMQHLIIAIDRLWHVRNSVDYVAPTLVSCIRGSLC